MQQTLETKTNLKDFLGRKGGIKKFKMIGEIKHNNKSLELTDNRLLRQNVY